MSQKSENQSGLKFYEAKLKNDLLVEVWGTGTPKREFMHVDDLAEATLFLMKEYNEKEFLNVGTGVDISIKDLAIMVKSTIGFKGDIYFNKEKPDGTARKLMDVSKINALGWKHRIDLSEGIKNTFANYLQAIK